MDRYKVARAQGKYHQVVEEDGALLGEFGLGLISVDNGLRVAVKKSLRGGHINPWDVLPIHPALWKVLQPLLVELRTRRATPPVSGEKSGEKSGERDGPSAVNGKRVAGRNGKKVLSVGDLPRRSP